jgi:hypothetical protein
MISQVVDRLLHRSVALDIASSSSAAVAVLT